MDNFNILNVLATQGTPILILGYVCYRLYKLYVKEKSDRIAAMKAFNEYLAGQVAARDEVIRGNTQVLSQLFKQHASKITGSGTGSNAKDTDRSKG